MISKPVLEEQRSLEPSQSQKSWQAPSSFPYPNLDTWTPTEAAQCQPSPPSLVTAHEAFFCGQTSRPQQFSQVPIDPFPQGPARQKINKETVALNDTLDQMDLTDIFRTFHPKTAEYTSFSSAYRTVSRIGNILGHKTSLNNVKKIKVNHAFFLKDHNAMKLEIKHKRNSIKTMNGSTEKSKK